MMQGHRLPPREELINLQEYEEIARMVLPPSAYALVAGSDRAAFDRMTFRPRMCIPTLEMDLTVDLMGEAHYTPVIVGPVAEQRQFHADGELATVRGASAAKAAVMISSRSSVPIAELAAAATTPLWFVVAADGGANARSAIDRALAAGCKSVCITVIPGRADWTAVEQLRKGLDVSVVIKGVLTVQEAQAALAQGARGVVVSSYGTQRAGAAIDPLQAIAAAIGDKAAVLVDGSFRRGSDILKALILGARGVLIARPVMWGLAAYGADGVQSVVELAQSDLGRQIGALGVSNVRGLTKGHLRVSRK
jgi:4-hydroxymandelate oxidase